MFPCMSVQFRIEGVLGTGPDGVVHQARSDRLGARPVALRPVAVPSASRARLRHDCEVLAALDHRGLAPVEDVVEVDDATVLLVSPLAPQGTLTDRLRLGPLGVDEAARLLVSLAGALAAAHRAGLTHRRLHAGNVLLGPSGPTIADLVQAGATGRRSATGDPVTDDVTALGRLGADLVDPADHSVRAEAFRAACADAATSGLAGLERRLGALLADPPPAGAAAPPSSELDPEVGASAALALVVAASTTVGVVLGAVATLLPAVG